MCVSDFYRICTFPSVVLYVWNKNIWGISFHWCCGVEPKTETCQWISEATVLPSSLPLCTSSWDNHTNKTWRLICFLLSSKNYFLKTNKMLKDKNPMSPVIKSIWSSTGNKLWVSLSGGGLLSGMWLSNLRSNIFLAPLSHPKQKLLRCYCYRLQLRVSALKSSLVFPFQSKHLCSLFHSAYITHATCPQ